MSLYAHLFLALTCSFTRALALLALGATFTRARSGRLCHVTVRLIRRHDKVAFDIGLLASLALARFLRRWRSDETRLQFLSTPATAYPRCIRLASSLRLLLSLKLLGQELHLHLSSLIE